MTGWQPIDMDSRHPAWLVQPSVGFDASSRDGAERLAATIRKAWAKVGISVRADVRLIGCWGEEGLYGVCLPDLVNGLYEPEGADARREEQREAEFRMRTHVASARAGAEKRRATIKAKKAEADAKAAEALETEAVL